MGSPKKPLPEGEGSRKSGVSTPSYSPGSWKFDGVDTINSPLANADIATLIAVRDPNHTHGGKYNTDTMEANARLIAAAPELYGALEAICESAEDGRTIPEWLQERLIAARTALAKARGES